MSAEPRTDPVALARHYWRQQELGPGEGAFIAMSSVLRFHRLLTVSIGGELKMHGLNLTDYLLLMTLELSEAGARPVSRLARALLVHATTATLAVDRFEARGLLSRGPHPSDRRATLVTISTEGRALARKATTALGEREYGPSGDSAADRAELVEILTRLRAGTGG
ncbi:MarR family winged helix-turn-helix transcriptional regulator [Sporichthya polymorpha]|uniref:MarR family winged helix-turn-helix transcriptional regulator n=1 Tax=Sporichthya polymorpha TaxID=35751 RepID=UPI00036C2B6E|nr:MarR family transcriptional regulator [Sporichthya polymorpha]